MNFGQMLMWHIVLIPIVLIAIVGAHVLMVRVRGVSHPLPASGHALARPRGTARPPPPPTRRRGAAATRRYDILKEGTDRRRDRRPLVLLMAGLLSSPDVPPLSVQTWARASAADFVGTAASELDGTALAASYGPPYNNGSSAVQQSRPVNWQNWPASPSRSTPATRPSCISPLSQAGADHAGAGQRAQHVHQRIARAAAAAWATAYDKAVHQQQGPVQQAALPGGAGGRRAGAGDDGLRAQGLAQAATLDADLLAQTKFYGTNYTKPLLFIADGGYYANLAERHCTSPAASGAS